LVGSIAIAANFSSCTSNHCHKISANDSNAIIKSYLVKLYPDLQVDKLDLNDFTKNRVAIPTLKFNLIPDGGPIDLITAQEEVKIYVDNAGVNALRSFHIDANTLKTCLGVPLSSGNANITNLKLIFATDKNDMTTSLVIVPYDGNGNYIFMSTGPQGQLQVYNQIAPCPSACPPKGQAQFDYLWSGAASSITTSRSGTMDGRIIQHP
jgi:hypothetical protein